MNCNVNVCDRPVHARGLCRAHYMYFMRTGGWPTHEVRDDGWVNPLVCDCAEPDPDTCCGMCRTCKRKPLALMAPKAVAR